MIASFAKLSLVLLWPVVMLVEVVVVDGFDLPQPTGPFVIGTQDFEFTDNNYYDSKATADAGGRRIMFRVWYPACDRSSEFQQQQQVNGSDSCGTTVLGRRRLYFEGDEWEVIFGEDEPESLTSMWVTNSYLDAPVAPSSTSRPVVIYAHGLGSWVSDNTALMEEMASHGYAVFALGSPGFASGVLYPNGDVATFYSELGEEDTVPHPLSPPWSDDLQIRYDKWEPYLTEGRIPSFFPRMRDDMLAMADYLDNFSNTTDLLGQLVGADGLQGLIYMGYSFAGAAAGSASQRDPRAQGAINMDGAHQSTDLLGKATRAPYLTFSQNAGNFPFYFNEFFFEPLETMGTNPDVTRVLMPMNMTHGDFSDLIHLDQTLREDFLNISTPVDGDYLYKVMTSFCLGFIDTHTGRRSDWTPKVSFDEFQDVEPVDVSYVAVWATRNEEEPDSSGDSSGGRLSYRLGSAIITSIVVVAFSQFLVV